MSDDPTIAASIMESTAGANARTQEPVYHLTLAFHPNDEVTHETMQRAADRVLAELQLTNHQALLIAHGDRPHAHVHVMVNRVHPETLIAWDRWKDYLTIDRTLRALEREWELHRVVEPERSTADAHTHLRPGDQSPEHEGADQGPKAGTRDRDAGDPGISPPSGADPVREAADAAHAYQSTMEAHTQADDAAEIARRAEDQARRYREASDRAQLAMERFSDVLSQVYADPRYAIRECFARAPHLSYRQTLDLFDKDPEALGTLKTDRADRSHPSGAQLAARAREAYEAVRAYHELWLQYGGRQSIAETAIELDRRAVEAAERAAELQAARAAAGTLAEQRNRVKDAWKRLAKSDRSRLRALVGASTWALLEQAVARLARPLLGHDEPER